MTLVDRVEKRINFSDEEIGKLVAEGCLVKDSSGKYTSDYVSQREASKICGCSNSTVSLAVSSKRIKKYNILNEDYVKLSECIESLGQKEKKTKKKSPNNVPAEKIDLSLLDKADKQEKLIHDLSQKTRLKDENGKTICTPKDFYVEQGVWEALHFSIANGEHVLITGSTGCGKSELVYELAKSIDKNLSAFNCGATQDVRSAWIGNVHIQDGKDVFVRSRFVKASCERGDFVLFDEINRINCDSTNILFSILDRQGYIPIDENETKAMKHKDTRFFATANLGSEYTGTEEIDAALVNRFSTIIELAFPPKDVEAKIIENRACFCNTKDIGVLLKVAENQRNHVKIGEMITPLSTRTLIDCARRKMCGFSWKDVLQNDILGRLDKSDCENSEQAQMIKIFQTQGLI